MYFVTVYSVDTIVVMNCVIYYHFLVNVCIYMYDIVLIDHNYFESLSVLRSVNVTVVQCNAQFITLLAAIVCGLFVLMSKIHKFCTSKNA